LIENSREKFISHKKIWSSIPRDWFTIMNNIKVKENIFIIIKAHLKSFDKDIIDKENTWNKHERNLFKIQMKNEAIVVYDLIKLKWFNFIILKQTQIDYIIHQIYYSNY